MESLKHYLEAPLLRLGGSAITPESLLIGAAPLVLTFLFAGMVGRWVRHLLGRRGAPLGTQFAVAKIVSYTLAGLGILLAVNSMGFRLDALLAAPAMLAVGIGFGLQNIAQNFISGLILLLEQPVRKGDFVQVNDVVGVIEDIGLRATHVITRDEVTVVVPNSELVTKSVINHSRPSPKLRIHVDVGVAYGSDVAQVRDTLFLIASGHPKILTDPPPEVRFDAFADSSLTFRLLCWVSDPDPDVDLRISSDLRYAIDTAFRVQGIEIPFPQHDVHVRTGLELSPAKATVKSA
jgi:small-conductance mechanosensitive channel